MKPPEVAEDQRKELRAELQRHGHADVVAVVRHVLNVIVQLIQLIQNMAYLAQQTAAVMRDEELAPLTMEEIESCLRLQRLHGHADRRL